MIFVNRDSAGCFFIKYYTINVSKMILSLVVFYPVTSMLVTISTTAIYRYEDN